MFFYEGQSCPVCNRKFQETDDIVSCPRCGAPHHRECWKQEGHCHFEADHGTERQYTRPAPAEPTPEPAPTAGNPPSGQAQANACPRCGNNNPEYAEFCSRCGSTLPVKPQQQAPYTPPVQPNNQYQAYGEYTPYHMPTYDPYGGVPAGEKIDDVAVEDVAALVGPNSHYYVPRFYKMKKTDHNISWNWAAFLLTPYWAFFRKNYLAGGILMAFFVAKSVLTNFIILQCIYPLVGSANTYFDLMEKIQSLAVGGSITLFLWVFMLLQLVNLLVRIMFGMFGNYFYFKTCSTRIHKLQANNQSFYKQQLTTAGGTSFLFGSIAYMALYFADFIIQSIFLAL